MSKPTRRESQWLDRVVAEALAENKPVFATPLRDDPNYRRSLRECLDGGARRPYYKRMSLRLLFWLIMIIILIFALSTNWGRWGTLAMPALQYVLFAILGWKVFGPPLRNE